jgi:hypothetical protein
MRTRFNLVLIFQYFFLDQGIDLIKGVWLFQVGVYLASYNQQYNLGHNNSKWNTLFMIGNSPNDSLRRYPCKPVSLINGLFLSLKLQTGGLQ